MVSSCSACKEADGVARVVGEAVLHMPFRFAIMPKMANATGSNDTRHFIVSGREYVLTMATLTVLGVYERSVLW